MEIEIEKLRIIFEQLIQYLDAQGVRKIEIHVDYYWHVPKGQVYDVYKNPSELSIGQLSDDWQELRRILNSEKPPIGYDFVLLSALLRAVGENIIG